MNTEQDLILGRVAELGAYDGGDRLKATLVPEDEGPPVRLDLKTPPDELARAIVLGARVGCRAYLRTTPRGLVRVAFWIDHVERREGPDQWERVWTAPKPFVARRRAPEPAPPPAREEARLEGGAVRRRRMTGGTTHDDATLRPSAAVEPEAQLREPEEPPRARLRAPTDDEDGELVTGTLRRLERMANMRTVGTILPDDGGPLVELRLRRAPRGLLAALAPGARVHCLAAVHASDPDLRFSARVVSVDLQNAEGNYREAWRHDPAREREGQHWRLHEEEEGAQATIVATPRTATLNSAGFPAEDDDDLER
jgi:hypothetical protein